MRRLCNRSQGKGLEREKREALWARRAHRDVPLANANLHPPQMLHRNVVASPCLQFQEDSVFHCRIFCSFFQCNLLPLFLHTKHICHNSQEHTKSRYGCKKQQIRTIDIASAPKELEGKLTRVRNGRMGWHRFQRMDRRGTLWAQVCNPIQIFLQVPVFFPLRRDVGVVQQLLPRISGGNE